MIAAYQEFWTRAFDFSGRTARPPFWYTVLDNFIILFVLLMLATKVEAFAALYTLYVIATIIPSLSMVIRRLRDAGKAWPWIFISFVPFIGGIWLLVLNCQPSIPG